MSESLYRMVSFGLVIEDKPVGTDIIKVTPIEELWDQPSGIIKDYKEEVIGDLPSLQTTNVKTEHEVRSFVEATWRSIGSSNRVSAPDVRRNMKVALYQYGNTEDYYWDVVGREPMFMGKEDVIIGYSNQPGGGDGAPYDINSMVCMRVNTREKYVQLSTPKNDGEPCSFNLKIDMKSGTWVIEDSNKNKLFMDAVNGKLHGYTNEEIFFETKNFKIKSKTYSLETDRSTENITNDKTTTTKLATYKSKVTVEQLLTAAGGLSASGGSGGNSVAITGNTLMTGNITVTGTATGRFPGPKS